jgi:membrane protease YdiL (CAAX protease family)
VRANQRLQPTAFGAGMRGASCQSRRRLNRGPLGSHLSAYRSEHMTTIAPPANRRYLIPFVVALFITLIMGIALTVLDVLQPSEPVLSILAFIPGIISIAALSASGLSRAELNLRFTWISLPGLLVLAAITVLLLPILGSSTGWTGWQWLPGLVYAPASGIAQEIYFRGSLLPALERALHGKKLIAILLHAVVFVGYHFRTFRSLSSLPIAILVAAVLFTAGCGWAWQVQRDRTVFWAIAQHSLFLMLMSMFQWA